MKSSTFLINSLDSLVKGIHSQDRRSIAKAITLAESTRDQDQKTLHKLLEKLNHRESIRLGITGSPGAGKSSFINTLGLHLVTKTSLGILVIDPSSPIYGGSILGDKTRMGELEQHQNVFIRPSPNGHGSINGGLRASIRILEAAGYETILIETVGAGQSEFEITSLVDLLMLIQIPNSGDELQGMKKGLLEVADIIIINKADGDLEHAAKLSQLEHKSSLSIHQTPPPILLASSEQGTGFDDIEACIYEEFKIRKQNGKYKLNRNKQDLECFEREVLKQFKKTMKNQSKDFKDDLENKILIEKKDPASLAHSFVANILSKDPSHLD